MTFHIWLVGWFFSAKISLSFMLLFHELSGVSLYAWQITFLTPKLVFMETFDEQNS